MIENRQPSLNEQQTLAIQKFFDAANEEEGMRLLPIQQTLLGLAT